MYLEVGPTRFADLDMKDKRKKEPRMSPWTWTRATRSMALPFTELGGD